MFGFGYLFGWCFGGYCVCGLCLDVGICGLQVWMGWLGRDIVFGFLVDWLFNCVVVACFDAFVRDCASWFGVF